MQTAGKVCAVRPMTLASRRCVDAGRKQEGWKHGMLL